MLAGSRILVVVASRVNGIVGVGTAFAFIKLHRAHGNFGLVEANECQVTAVGTPSEGVEHSKFLLVNPVGDSVDDFIFLSIGGHLYRSSTLHVLDKYIVVSNVSNLISVGRKSCDFLAAILGEWI